MTFESPTGGGGTSYNGHYREALPNSSAKHCCVTAPSPNPRVKSLAELDLGAQRKTLFEKNQETKTSSITIPVCEHNAG